MFCAECGTRNTPDSKYCKECGTRVDEGYRKIMLSIDDRSAVQDEGDQERLTQLLDMAFWHNEAGHTDSALRACEAALVIHPNCTTAHSLLGTLFEKKGDDDRAIRHFERVVELNPASAADAAKLDQIKRGVHIRPVAPPAVYKWVPPALSGFALGGFRARLSDQVGKAGKADKSEKADAAEQAEPSETPKRSRPLVAAGVAAVMVLVAGFTLLIRSSAPHTAQADPANGQGVVVKVSASGLATQAAPPPQSYTLPPPVYYPSVQTTTAIPPQYGPDPFAGPIPPSVAPDDLRLARIRDESDGGTHHSHRTDGAGTVAALPPLDIEPLPVDTSSDNGGGVLSTAPVSTVPVTATVADVPEHVVPVTELPAATEPVVASAAPASSVPSHIHITIHSGSDSAGDGATNIGDDDGDSFQQDGLALQEQGDYRHALAAYEKAVRAYKAQIASGVDVDAANRGLDASQTGLQICQQAQP